MYYTIGDARRASLLGDRHRLWIVHGTVSEARDRSGRWVPSTPDLFYALFTLALTLSSHPLRAPLIP